MRDGNPDKEASSTGLSPRLAAVLAYSAWWISGFLFWWIERHDPYVRFHAAQAIIVFGIFSVVVIALAGLAVASLALMPDAFVPLLWAAGATWAGGEVLWVLAIWHAARGNSWRMPIVGGIAERLAIVTGDQ